MDTRLFCAYRSSNEMRKGGTADALSRVDGRQRCMCDVTCILAVILRVAPEVQELRRWQ